MRQDEFQIGKEFTCGGKQWRCTDVGRRVIVAICISEVQVTSLKNGNKETSVLNRQEAEKGGWFNGPPYSAAECVFDENDMPACELPSR